MWFLNSNLSFEYMDWSCAPISLGYKLGVMSKVIISIDNIVVLTFPEEELNSQNDLFKEIIFKKIKAIENKIEDLHSLKNDLEKVVYNIENYNIRSCIEINKKEY